MLSIIHELTIFKYHPILMASLLTLRVPLPAIFKKVTSDSQHFFPLLPNLPFLYKITEQSYGPSTHFKKAECLSKPIKNSLLNLSAFIIPPHQFEHSKVLQCFKRRSPFPALKVFITRAILMLSLLNLINNSLATEEMRLRSQDVNQLMWLN